MAMQSILIIEDESDIRELITLTLTSAGYTTLYQAEDGETGLRLAQSLKPDLVLLDLMLPGIDGLDVCRYMQTDQDLRRIPIIFLTAKAEESDIVLGLELGAIDYIIKPFSNKVLIARIRSHFRQATPNSPTRELTYSGFVLNPDYHTLFIQGKDYILTANEFAILHLLMAHPGRVYTRNQIINTIKGENYPVTDRSVDVQIVSLRKKLGQWGLFIETIRSVGYKMKSL